MEEAASAWLGPARGGDAQARRRRLGWAGRRVSDWLGEWVGRPGARKNSYFRRPTQHNLTKSLKITIIFGGPIKENR
jgi:hypothetical protein